MDNKTKVAVSEFIRTLSDREWHDLYEFHDKYRLSPELVSDVVSYLLKLEVVIKLGARVKLSENSPNRILAILNRVQKTRRPNEIDAADWR